MSNLENNKLIAEFMMGGEVEDGFNAPMMAYLDDEGEYHHEEDLQYHTSWDWLMPVISKINEVSEYDDYCKDRLHLQRVLDDCINENALGIIAVHKAVVEFINEYNKKKKA